MPLVIRGAKAGGIYFASFAINNDWFRGPGGPGGGPGGVTIGPTGGGGHAGWLLFVFSVAPCSRLRPCVCSNPFV